MELEIYFIIEVLKNKNTEVRKTKTDRKEERRNVKEEIDIDKNEFSNKINVNIIGVWSSSPSGTGSNKWY